MYCRTKQVTENVEAVLRSRLPCEYVWFPSLPNPLHLHLQQYAAHLYIHRTILISSLTFCCLQIVLQALEAGWGAEITNYSMHTDTDAGVNCAKYHAGLSCERRKETHHKFLRDELQVHVSGCLAVCLFFSHTHIYAPRAHKNRRLE